MSQPKSVYKILSPQEEHWVGDGFFVSTIFSIASIPNRYISPFILMDHAAPRHFPPTQDKLGVGEHPHRGFETVTFAIQGEIEHRDSGGGGGVITTGGVQWMTAASGVVHDEFHSRDFAKKGGEFEMVQLWVNLRAKDKMKKPAYQSLNQMDFPSFTLNSAQVTLVAGDFQGYKGPAVTQSPMTIFRVQIAKDQKIQWDLQHGHNTLLFALKGESNVLGQKTKARDLVVLEREGNEITVEAHSDSEFLVLSGEPIDEPMAHYGPFVMNNKNEIVQAIEDFQAGRMGSLVDEKSSN